MGSRNRKRFGLIGADIYDAVVYSKIWQMRLENILRCQTSWHVVQQEQVTDAGQSASKEVKLAKSHKKSTDPVNEFEWKVNVARVVI